MIRENGQTGTLATLRNRLIPRPTGLDEVS